jgi:hypothetical protein
MQVRVLPVDFFGVEAARRVAQFVEGETVETGVVGVQLGGLTFAHMSLRAAAFAFCGDCGAS